MHEWESVSGRAKRSGSIATCCTSGGCPLGQELLDPLALVARKGLDHVDECRADMPERARVIPALRLRRSIRVVPFEFHLQHVYQPGNVAAAGGVHFGGGRFVRLHRVLIHGGIAPR